MLPTARALSAASRIVLDVQAPDAALHVFKQVSNFGIDGAQGFDVIGPRSRRQ